MAFQPYIQRLTDPWQLPFCASICGDDASAAVAIRANDNTDVLAIAHSVSDPCPGIL